MRRREAPRRLGGAASTAQALRAEAQQSAVPVIDCFGTASPNLSASRLHTFHQVLGNRPVEGCNVMIGYRWAEGRSIECRD
jgi:hypothetical protein